MQTLPNYRCFTCSLYGAKKSESDVNTLRHQLFCSKQANIEGHKLPPCADCLYKHCQPACYQTAAWKRAMGTNPEIPIGKGWIQHKGDSTALAVDWMEGLPAPDAVLEFMSVSCTCVCKPHGVSALLMDSTVQKCADWQYATW